MCGMRKGLCAGIAGACLLLAGCADRPINATDPTASVVAAVAVAAAGQAACADLANPTAPLVVAEGVIAAVAQGAFSTDSTALIAELTQDGASSPGALASDMNQIITQLRAAGLGQPVNIAAVNTAADAAAYWCGSHGFAQPSAY